MVGSALKSNDKIIVYMGASLFNGRETSFNIDATNRLENRGYQVILPQRDGFEFGELGQRLSSVLRNEDEVSFAVQNVIYLLDVGRFVPKSHVVVANFDEPIDEGLVVEVCYGKVMGKFTVGFKTDVRSPYGQSSDPFGGMHFFPAFSSDVFIKQHMPNKTVAETAQSMEILVGKIDDAITNAGISAGSVDLKKMRRSVDSIPHLAKVLDLAEKLFEGVDDIHSEEGLAQLAKKYVAHKTEIEGIRPAL